VIKHGQEKRRFLKDLIPCLHFSENFKNLENLGGVKLKHLLEIQNTPYIRETHATQCRHIYARVPVRDVNSFKDMKTGRKLLRFLFYDVAPLENRG
jgi:hypothetical protein